MRARRAANPEKERTTRRAWLAANQVRVRTAARAWHAAHPEKRREYEAARSGNRSAARRDQDHRRRAGIKKADPETIAYAETLRNDPCNYCGAPAPSTVDHIVPLSKGGVHHWTNLVAACQSCNSSKGTKSLAEFLLWRRQNDNLQAV
jgi:5-methylcytosine-specific restriction endonuclease McrA